MIVKVSWEEQHRLIFLEVDTDRKCPKIDYFVYRYKPLLIVPIYRQ